MGTWGHGPFDNDAAGDLLADATDAASPATVVTRALRCAARAPAAKPLDVDDGAAAVAACELVAIASGHGASDAMNDPVVAAGLAPAAASA